MDSCLDPTTQKPAALSYLAAMGVETTEVALVLVTHWDDDHIKGIGEIVGKCPGASVACSMALRREEILQFVCEQEAATGAHGSGLDELATVLGHCRSTGRLVWAKATLPLHPRLAGGDHTVVALSPSDDAVSRSIESLIEEATREKISFRRRYKAPEGPNGASVAAVVRSGASILLGADLENSNNPLTGWDAVLSYARPDRTLSAVKVPHHGSRGAHNGRVWDELMDDSAIAIVTPWQLGGRFLPTDQDLDRLKRVADRVFVTSRPTLKKLKGPRVDRFVQKVADRPIAQVTGWGHVRARIAPSDGVWRVDLAGDAQQVT